MNYTSLSRGYDTPHLTDGTQEKRSQCCQHTARFFLSASRPWVYTHIHRDLDISLLQREIDPQQSP